MGHCHRPLIGWSRSRDPDAGLWLVAWWVSHVTSDLECVTLSGRTAHNLAHSLCRHVRRTSIIQYRWQWGMPWDQCQLQLLLQHTSNIWLLNLICNIQFMRINELISQYTCLFISWGFEISGISGYICVPPSSKACINMEPLHSSHKLGSK